MRVNSGQQSIVEFLVLAHFYAHVVDKKGFVFFFPDGKKKSGVLFYSSLVLLDALV